jgi:hypothetical protein
LFLIVDAHPRDLIIALDPRYYVPQSTVVLFLPYFLYFTLVCTWDTVVAGTHPSRTRTQGGDAAL